MSGFYDHIDQVGTPPEGAGADQVGVREALSGYPKAEAEATEVPAAQEQAAPAKRSHRRRS